MREEKGFVLILSLVLGVLILFILIGMQSGYLGDYLERFSKAEKIITQQKTVILRDTVSYRIKDNHTGEVKEGEIGMLPVDIFDYRLKIVNSDYKTFAEIMVENVGMGVYQVVKMEKGQSKTIGSITLSVTDMTSTDCEFGMEC